MFFYSTLYVIDLRRIIAYSRNEFLGGNGIFAHRLRGRFCACSRDVSDLFTKT